MKNFIYVLILIFACISCKKEAATTTYQVVNNSTLSTSSMEYLDGSIYEVVVYHYSGTDIIKQDAMDKVAAGGGKSEIIEVPASSEKIKVSYKMLPPQSTYYDLSSNHRLYVVAYTLIKQGENNVILLDDNTMVGGTLTKSNIKDELLKMVK